MKNRVILIAVLISTIFLNLNCDLTSRKYKLSQLHAPNTTSEKRQQFKNNLIKKTILENLSFELNSENESKWQGAFWGMELALYRSDSILNILKLAFDNWDDRSESFQRACIEAIYCLYPREFYFEILKIAQSTSSSKLFAMAIHYLSRIKNDPEYFENLMIDKFNDWRQQPILYMLSQDLKLNISNQEESTPPIVDLLSHPFKAGQTIVYSLQRKDRNYPGLVVIKKSDGKFIRNENGSIFQITQLARAISNLPGYITNGNTPQGIFSIQGIDASSNVFIGSTPNLQLVLPFEASPVMFFHNSDDHPPDWSQELYTNLLPVTWRDYLLIYEAFYAGKAGRTEIIAHGTTIDPEFYVGNSYYPNTPSLGCLCAKEIWSVKNGECLVSDQLSFINAFRSAKCKTGFLIVIELNDKKCPVVLDEILCDLLKAEGSL